MGRESESAISSYKQRLARRKRVVLAAAKRIVEENSVTICTMEPEYGFTGPVCPVVNCYMRNYMTGACEANITDVKVSGKAMRDTITIVELIDAVRNAPSWVNNKTYHPTTVDSRFDTFVKEVGVEKSQLQYVIDHNPLYANTLLTVMKVQQRLAA